MHNDYIKDLLQILVIYHELMLNKCSNDSTGQIHAKGCKEERAKAMGIEKKKKREDSANFALTRRRVFTIHVDGPVDRRVDGSWRQSED